MRDFEALQRAFASALDAPCDVDVDVRVLVGEADVVRQRFALYRGNQRTNLERALRNAYPVFARVIGDASFATLVRAYGDAHPSQDGDLNLAGDRLAAFVEDHSPLPRGWPAPLAALEWAVHRAHYAADAPALDVARLAAIPAERYGDLRLVAAPGVTLFRFDWTVASLWRAHAAGEHHRAIEEGVEHALVTRPHHRVDVRIVSAAEHACLALCLEGAPLERAVDAALAHDAAFAFDAVLGGWVSDRTFVDARLVD